MSNPEPSEAPAEETAPKRTSRSRSATKSEVVSAEGTPKIYPAMLKAMAAVGEVPKNGHFSAETRAGGTIEYDYVKGEDVQAAVQKAMIEAGVIQEATLKIKRAQIPDANQAGFRMMTEAHLKLKLISTEDGSFIRVKAVGEGAGTDDKAIRKAVTSAEKIVNILAFKVAIADMDPDDGPAPQAPAAQAGPTRGQQRVAAAKDKPEAGAPRTAATPAQEAAAAAPTAQTGEPTVKDLQAQIRAAAAERAKVEPGFDYAPFGNKLTGKSSAAWAQDLGDLQRVLAAIVGGEAAE